MCLLWMKQEWGEKDDLQMIASTLWQKRTWQLMAHWKQTLYDALYLNYTSCFFDGWITNGKVLGRGFNSLKKWIPPNAITHSLNHTDWPTLPRKHVKWIIGHSGRCRLLLCGTNSSYTRHMVQNLLGAPELLISRTEEVGQHKPAIPLALLAPLWA